MLFILQHGLVHEAATPIIGNNSRTSKKMPRMRAMA